MLWLALHFPRLPLEIFTARHNNPQSAIVLLHKNRVFMCNPTAKDYGIAVGSTLATACSIEPEVVHGYRDIEAEATRLSTLADILYRFSSYVSVQHPDCIILEIGGSLKLFGCHQQLMDEAIKLASTLGHDVCA
ncbi:MAG: hypothetical protein GXP16_17310, partial [Gammaproteobacteria bacterium]|nr:hypothetical protein [Gammaproteobacteria bacterium]